MVYPQRDDEKRYGEESPARHMQTPEEHVDQPGGRMDTAKPPAYSRQEENPVSLVPPDVVTEFRAKWNSIQIKFVDEPRGAVKEADTLVAGMIRRMTELFANERSGLEQQWSRGDNVSTEDLRIAMQRYRSFFDRLLSH
jgi:hypothetical protein